MINKFKKVYILCKSGKTFALLYILLRKMGFKRFLPPLPLSLIIESTNLCNLRCPGCPTTSGRMNRPRRMMRLTEFKAIIDQVRGYVQHILLYWCGEPFLNKELLDMIKYAVSAGIVVGISTHGGSLKSREFCLAVVKSGLQQLTIALDGADQKTHSKFRKDSKFNDVLKGFKFINEAKKELGSQTPEVCLQLIVMKHNESQRNHMKKLVVELECDRYNEKTIHLGYDDLEFQENIKEFLPKDLSLSRYYRKEDGTFMLKGKVSNGWPYA